jgi:CHAD domain-containing protein
MEFFVSLFAREKIKRLIKQLKKLQDNLGRLNDLSVQEQYLLSIAQEMPARSRKTQKMLVAVGSLVGALNAEKQAVKQRFAQIFRAYASSSNRRLFRELFASEKKKVSL